MARPSLRFSVDQSSTSVNTPTFVLTGEHGADINKVVINGAEADAQITNSRWRVDVILSAGDNVFTIRGRYDDGTTTVDTLEHTVTITYTSTPVEVDQYWGPLDRHGLLFDLERIPGESNPSYRARLRNVYEYPPGSHYEGLMNGISRELGLTVQRGAVVFEANQDAYGEYWLRNPTLKLNQTRLWFTGANILASEVRQINPNGFRVTLTYDPVDETAIQVFALDGNKVDGWAYDPRTNAVTLTSETYLYQWVRVEYQYWKWIDIFRKTLADVDTLLSAEVDDDGNQYITMTYTVAGTSRADGIIQSGTYRLDDDEDPAEFDWVNLNILEASDTLVRDALLNDDGTYFGSELGAIAQLAKKNLRITWGQTVLDVDRWDPLTGSRPTAFLPHLWDTKVADWYTQVGTARYSAAEYAAYGGYTPDGSQELMRDGLSREHFQSGVGREGDLSVDITEV